MASFAGLREGELRGVQWPVGRRGGGPHGDTVQCAEVGLLVINPAEGIRLPKERRGKRKAKPHITPEQFDELLNEIPEPYATMVYVAIYTGLRVSELAALRWNDLGFDSITVDERFCRGEHSDVRTAMRYQHPELEQVRIAIDQRNARRHNSRHNEVTLQ